MSQTLEAIAQQLRDAGKRVQLIYAFNGNGKTRLSRAMKELVAPRVEGEDEVAPIKILYYSAFTEDLFYWDNGLRGDGPPKLMIQPNSFTDWVLGEQGQDVNVARILQHYTNANLTPTFNQAYTRDAADGGSIAVSAFSEVTFAIEAGDDMTSEPFKISKGEESCFIWSIFYALLETVVAELTIPEADERSTDQFNALEYVFIDDPVTSLDENHLIELAVNLAALIKSAPSPLKFVVTTHNPLFYNVLHSELGMKKRSANQGCYLLERLMDGSFNLTTKDGAANKSFSYHLHLRRILEEAILEDKVERYHFTLLRNLYEKTAGFLGHDNWGDLLNTAAGSKDAYVRMIHSFSHSSLSSEQVREPTAQEKQTVKFLLDNLIDNYGYLKEDA